MFVWMLFIGLIKAQNVKAEYFEFCDKEYQSVPKHLSAGWLSLECCLVQILKKFPSLRSYFVSEDFRDERFRRLNYWFSNRHLEPALLFNQCAISNFTNFNLLLQREQPTIHQLKSSMKATKLAARITKPVVLRNVFSVKEIDLSDDSVFIDVKSILLGGATKAKLNRLLKEGDIT